MSLKGARFAREEVAFDKGIARVQVNSISSAVEIMDTIIATISDADAYNNVYSTAAHKETEKVSDVVFIQFGAEMSIDAFRSTYYQINDKALPEGVNITATETVFIEENKDEKTEKVAGD